MFGRLGFSVAGPAAWNSLPDYLRDLTSSFRRDMKNFPLGLLVLPQHIGGFAIMRYCISGSFLTVK